MHITKLNRLRNENKLIIVSNFNPSNKHKDKTTNATKEYPS